MLSTARMVLAVTMNMPQSVSLHVPATISMKNIMVVFLIVVMLLHASIRITVGVTSGVWVQHGIWQKKTLSVNTIGSTCWSWRLLSVSRGNDNLYYKGYTNYYPYLDQFTVSGSDGVFSDGVLYYKGSKDITWETSNSFNVGVDFALLGGRIDGTIEYFNRQTKDMLYYKPVAMSTVIPNFLWISVRYATRCGNWIELYSYWN